MSEAGYGADTHCDTRLRTGRIASGLSNYGLACLRRQITPRGMLRDRGEPANYGIDLSELVGTLGIAMAAAALPGLIRAELSKDDRTADVDTTVTREDLPGGLARLRVFERITGHDSAEVFELTLSVSESGTELISAVVRS